MDILERICLVLVTAMLTLFASLTSAFITAKDVASITRQGYCGDKNGQVVQMNSETYCLVSGELTKFPEWIP